MVGALTEAREAGEHPLDIGFELRRRPGEAAEADIVDDTELRKDLAAFRHEHEAAFRDIVRDKVLDAGAVQPHFAANGAMQAAERAHQSGFSGAVRAEHADKLAFVHDEVDAMERGNGAVACREIFHRDDGFAVAKRFFATAIMHGAFAEIGFQHLLVAAHLFRRAVGDFRSGIENDDVIGDSHHEFHVVLDKHHRDVERRDLPQKRAERFGVLRTQAGGRLVEHQHRGARCERARDFHEALVDMGERGRLAVDGAGVTDESKQAFREAPLIDITLHLAAAEMAFAKSDQDVVDHRHLAEELRRLIGAGNAGLRDGMRGRARDFLRADRDGAGGRLVEAADEIERGRLAGAVRPDHARDFPGFGFEGEVGHGANTAEGDREVMHLESLSVGAREKGGNGFRRTRGFAIAVLFKEALDQTDDPAGREPQHEKEQHADEEQAIFREEGEHLRQEHDDNRAEQRAERAVGAADHDHEEEHDRLEEREGFGANEAGHRGKDAARESRHYGRKHEGRDPHHDRIEADRLAGDFRIADRAHCLAPGALAEPGKKSERGDREKEDQKRGRPLAELEAEKARLRNIEKTVPAAGHLFPLGRNLFDHEAEGDGHHRKIRPAHAQRRQRERAARDAAHDHRDRERRPEIPAVVGGEDGDGIGADGVKADMAERDLPAQAKQDVEADADDGGEADKRQNVNLIAVGVRKGRNRKRDKDEGQEKFSPVHLTPSSSRRGQRGRSAASRE